MKETYVIIKRQYRFLRNFRPGKVISIAKRMQQVKLITLPESNIAFENGWLENEISFFGDVLFSGGYFNLSLSVV